MPSPTTFTHVTIGGQRWDQISFQYYGSGNYGNDIITANPGVPVYDILPDGVVLQIPIKATAAVQTAQESLPPWKQSSATSTTAPTQTVSTITTTSS